LALFGFDTKLIVVQGLWAISRYEEYLFFSKWIMLNIQPPKLPLGENWYVRCTNGAGNGDQKINKMPILYKETYE